MKVSKVSIGLINPKSPDNVSAVMRAAGNFRVDSIYYAGKRYPRALNRNPDLPYMSRKLSQNVPLSEVTFMIDDMPADMSIVCVEFA